MRHDEIHGDPESVSRDYSDRECSSCGDLTQLNEDELCKACVEAIEGEDEGNETSDFEQRQGDDKLNWTREDYIRGEP